ncbi:MAG TPA: RidA family protein [Acetobacteraceae bacterium]|nr:RidA family protein [Acetobacteraceae bacterium]
MSGAAARPGAEQMLRERAIKLSEPPTPLGAYVETIESGKLLFLSGVLPVVGGKAAFTGQLGAELTVEQGRQAARVAALNALALVREHLGSLDRVGRMIRLGVSIATVPRYAEHAKVADGASELFADIFGDAGLPVRVVLGVVSLPLDTPIELDVLFEVAENP